MKNMLRDESTRTLTIPRSSVFSDAASGLRVLSKKYFVDIEVIHRHDFFELVLVRSGGGGHVTESGESPLGRGDVYLIRPGNVHYYRDLQSLEIINILYLPERLDLPLGELRTLAGYIAFFEASPTLADSLLPTAVKLGETEMREAERILARVFAEQEAARPGCAFGMMAGFMQLILLISRAATRNCSETTAALGEIGRLLTIQGLNAARCEISAVTNPWITRHGGMALNVAYLDGHAATTPAGKMFLGGYWGIFWTGFYYETVD